MENLDNRLGDAYARDGFVVVPEVFDASECAALRAESVALCRGAFGAIRGFEPPAPGADDSAAMARYMVGVMPHKLAGSLFARQLHHPWVVGAVTRLIGPDVKAVHSQIFFKAPGMPGNALHQDERFIPTRDRSLVTAWIALEDARIANGCLRLIPGSHRPSVLWPMRRHESPELDRAEEIHGFPWPRDALVPVEVPAGSVVFFDGYLIHGSYPNRSAGQTRRALLYVYASAATPVLFDPASYQTTTEDYPDIVMVAGRDPYGWVQRHRHGEPYLRPAGPTVADLELARRNAAQPQHTSR
jgi:ectoine hydroxylase-related dioxygenase (phytanoyl-CoA dioxygenase family)